MGLEVLNRVGCLEVQDRGQRDPYILDLQMDHLK